MTTINGTTRTIETSLPAIGGKLRIASSMAEDGIFFNGIDISHNECANIKPGTYRITSAEYGAHFSTPGFSGYHVEIGLEMTDMEDETCSSWKAMNAMHTFIDHIRASEDLLEIIEDFLGDHMEKDPETLTWGDTGDAARLREMLTDIIHAFNLDTTEV